METEFPCIWVLSLDWDTFNQSPECPERQLCFTLIYKMKKFSVNRTERI